MRFLLPDPDPKLSKKTEFKKKQRDFDFEVRQKLDMDSNLLYDQKSIDTINGRQRKS